MGEGSSEEADRTECSMDSGGEILHDEDKMGGDLGISRAIREDNIALLLSAVKRIRKEASDRIGNGADALKTLDQEISTRLLHLACKHDSVECARVLVEGGTGTAAQVNGRDRLARTPLHIAAEMHSARCIELLLSKNAPSDLSSIDGKSLLALEIALSSRREQVNWSLDNSIEDLLASLQERDLSAIKLLAEKTREAGEVAYTYAMEGRIVALAMLLLVAEEKLLAPVRVAIEGVRTKKSIYDSVLDEALSMGDVSVHDGNERRKALLCEIQLLNHFGAASWRDCNNDTRSLPPLLRASKFGDVNVTKLLLMGDTDVNEVDSDGNTALHWCLSGSSNSQEPRILWLLLKNGARVFHRNKLGLTPVHIAAAKGNYKALQSLLLHGPGFVDMASKTKETPLFFAVKSGSVVCAQLLLRFGANTQARNLRKQRPVDLATSQDLRFILNPTNTGPWSCSSVQEDRVLLQSNELNKEGCKELLDDDDDNNECYPQLKTSLNHHDLPSSNGHAKGAKSQYSHKLGPKYVSRYNLGPKHDYSRKIFVGGLPPSVDSEQLKEFFNAEFGPVEEAVVIGTRTGDQMQSRGFGFVKFESEEAMLAAKEAHHVFIFGKKVEIKSAVAKASLPTESQKATSLRPRPIRKDPNISNSELTGQLLEEPNIQTRRPLPEKSLPCWFFIFRKWLPGFLKEATERLGGEWYPLCSLKGDFRATCRMELDHVALGYPKLSDFMHSLPGICRMRVVSVATGPATHMVLLPSLSRPKYVPLLAPYSSDPELPDSGSDQRSPRSPLITKLSEDPSGNMERQQGDNCTENGSLLEEVTSGTQKLDLLDSGPTTCLADHPVERATVNPSSCEARMRFSFFQSQWDNHSISLPKSGFCIICQSCEATVQLVPCLHDICVACMTRCTIRACMICGTAVNGFKPCFAPLDTKYPHMGLGKCLSEPRCQLKVVCLGAEATVRCSPCMHSIACCGCLLASETLPKACVICGCAVEHFKFA